MKTPTKNINNQKNTKKTTNGKKTFATNNYKE